MKKNNAKPANPWFYWILGLSVIIPYGHSHASLLVEMGFSPLLIAERLGHEKVQPTMDTYSHLYPNKQVELAKQLDGIMP